MKLTHSGRLVRLIRAAAEEYAAALTKAKETR